MAKYSIEGSTLTNIANHLRTQLGQTGGMTPEEMATLIDNLVKLPELTTPGTADDLRNGKQLIDASGNIITGSMPDSGGGGVDTCTMQVTSTYGNGFANYVIYSRYVNGEVVPELLTASVINSPLTITDVICGSAFTVYSPKNIVRNTISSNIVKVTESGTGRFSQSIGICVKTPTTAGATGTITITAD